MPFAQSHMKVGMTGKLTFEESERESVFVSGMRRLVCLPVRGGTNGTVHKAEDLSSG